MGPGGKGTNQAIAAARLGAQVDLLACLGDDPFADSAEQLYAREGVATDHVHRISGTNTGVGMVTLLPSGENSIVGHLGANLQLHPHHVEEFEPVIARSDVLMAQLEVPLESVTRALELGRKHRVMTLLNPAPGQTLQPDALAYVDVLTPNENETRILLGLPPDDPTPTEDFAGRLLQLGVETFIVTTGEEGSLIITASGIEPSRRPAYRPASTSPAPVTASTPRSPSVSHRARTCGPPSSRPIAPAHSPPPIWA